MKMGLNHESDVLTMKLGFHDRRTQIEIAFIAQGNVIDNSKQ